MDDIVYNLIYNTNFLIRDECEHFNYYITQNNYTMDSICHGESLFILILVEFLNQTIVAGQIIPSQINALFSVFYEMNELILTRKSSSEYMNIILFPDGRYQYILSVTKLFGGIHCNGMLFLDILSEIPNSRISLIIPFKNEIKKLLKLPLHSGHKKLRSIQIAIPRNMTFSNLECLEVYD